MPVIWCSIAGVLEGYVTQDNTNSRCADQPPAGWLRCGVTYDEPTKGAGVQGCYVLFDPDNPAAYLKSLNIKRVEV